MRAQATVAGRQAQLAALRLLAQNDQGVIAQAVATLGGRVERHFWMDDLVAVEVPRAAIPVLRANPRVVRMTPVKGHSCADVNSDAGSGLASAPIGTSTDSLNHNVAQAWNMLANDPGSPNPQGTPYKGLGARIAVFDTGIDADSNGATAALDHHPSFAVQGGTRIETHLQAQETRHVDVNTISPVGPYYYGGSGPFGYRPSGSIMNFPGHSGSCGHGTAMAAIIAGTAYGTLATGHAPDATLIDVAISSVPTAVGSTVSSTWWVTDNGYISAVEQLREYILIDGSDPTLHVINISYSGDPNPDNEAILALDKLARELDTLIVVCAGNDTDHTRNSIGCYHALAVGAVHARTSVGPSNFSFAPMLQTSRGPLASDHRRHYPDVCATGAGPGTVVGGTREFRYPIGWANATVDSCMVMPGIDLNDQGALWPANDVTPRRLRYGTSEAAAQVSGAAALYRGYRLFKGVPASAEETRAAILLNVLGTFTDPTGTASDASLQHAYSGRNTVGVGYVRDDLLAEFAWRDPLINPFAGVLTVSPSQTEATYSWGQLSAGARYAVVACWQRYNTEEEADPQELEIPDVDLEVEVGTSVIAKSASRANNYERLVFVAPSSAVTLRVTLASTVRSYAVPVQIVARKLPTDLDPATNVADVVNAATGFIESTSAGSGCTVISAPLDVMSIVPTNYSETYGSEPFGTVQGTGPGTLTWSKHRGFAGRGWNLGSAASRHIRLMAQAETLPTTPHTITGLAFRTWKPLSVSGDITLSITIEERANATAGGGAFYGLNDLTDLRVGPGQASTQHVRISTYSCSVTLRNPGPQAPDDFWKFSVLAPFPTPFVWTGGHLHLWLSGPGGSSSLFYVDRIDDGWQDDRMPPVPPFGPVAVYWLDPLGLEHVRTFDVPIIGFLGPSTPIAREPLLEVLGSAWSSQGLHVRLTGVPANTGTLLYFGGFAPLPLPLPPNCTFYLDGSAGVVFDQCNGAGVAEYQISTPAGLVHYQLGLQAVWGVSPTMASNALRVTIGGAL